MVMDWPMVEPKFCNAKKYESLGGVVGPLQLHAVSSPLTRTTLPVNVQPAIPPMEGAEDQVPPVMLPVYASKLAFTRLRELGMANMAEGEIRQGVKIRGRGWDWREGDKRWENKIYRVKHAEQQGSNIEPQQQKRRNTET